MQARVLVVEADPTLRRRLAALVESSGYPCQTADSLPAAIEALRRNSFSLVIFDLDLAGQDDAAAELRAANPALRLIGLDSVAEHRAGHSGRAQLDAVIPKPFLVDPLLAAMGHLVAPRV
jgi:DNA-binding response OmpR family regulator